VVAYSCDYPATLMLSGGTDVDWAPPMDYFRYVVSPLFSRFGVNVRSTLYRRGYYPEGGGRLRAEIMPAGTGALPVELLSRGSLKRIHGRIHYAGLPYTIPGRIYREALKALRETGIPENRISIRLVKEKSPGNYPTSGSGHTGSDHTGRSIRRQERKMHGDHFPGSPSTGCGLTLWAEFENSVIGAGLPGRKRLKSETLVRRVVDALVPELFHHGAVDIHAADQLVILAAVSAVRSGRKCSYSCGRVSEHTSTAIWLCERFLQVKFEIVEKRWEQITAERSLEDEAIFFRDSVPGVRKSVMLADGESGIRAGVYVISALPV